MAARGKADNPLVSERQHVEGTPAGMLIDDNSLDRAFCEPLQQPLRGADVDRELHRAVTAAKGSQQGRQQTFPAGWRAGQRNMARHAALEPKHMSLRAFRQGDELPRMNQQLFARMREAHTLACAAKKTCAGQLRFQGANMLAYRGLRESKPRRRGRKTAAVRDCQKCTEVIGVKHGSYDSAGDTL